MIHTLITIIISTLFFYIGLELGAQLKEWQIENELKVMYEQGLNKDCLIEESKKN